MEFLVKYGYVICVVAILAAGALIAATKFVKMSREERTKTIMAWLLQAVIAAEKEFGGKTGELKLSYVYDKFCERFPDFAKAIPFSVFQTYVDDALEQMRSLIETNEAIASVLEQKD